MIRRERLRDLVAVVDVLLVAAARGDRGVGQCEDLILGHTLAGVVDDTQLELCVRIVLDCRLAPPVDRLRVVLRNACTFGVQQTQVVLRLRIAGRGRFAEPCGGLHVVLLHTVAGRIDESQLLLRVDVILRRRLANPGDALRLVLGVAFAEFVQPPDSILGFGVAALRQRAVFLDGGGVVLPGQCIVAFLEAGEGCVAAQQD